jgi:hypothetical protein
MLLQYAKVLEAQRLTSGGRTFKTATSGKTIGETITPLRTNRSKLISVTEMEENNRESAAFAGYKMQSTNDQSNWQSYVG